MGKNARIPSHYSLRITHYRFGTFVPKQPALDLDSRAAPGVHEAADPAAAQHAMAGNDERDAVCPAGAAHGTRRRAQLPCNVQVSERPAARNGANRAPHLALEVGAAVIERQVEAEIRVVEIAPDLAADALGQAVERIQRRGALRQVVDAGEGLAGGMQGWLFKKTNSLERWLLIIAGLCLVYPRAAFDYIGLALLIAVVVMQLLRKSKPYAGAG